MKKSRKRLLIFLLCGLLVAGCVTAGALIIGNGEAESSVVSTALQHLANNAYLACSAPVGEEICFSPEWLDQTLRGNAVTAITISVLPKATEGQLLLGHAPVKQGEVIGRDALSYLRFQAESGVLESSFEFVPQTAKGAVGYALCCQLRLFESANCCPTGTKAITPVSTQDSLGLEGKLTATDPEGEALRFEILSYPEHGTLTLDPRSGSFRYLPTAGFQGCDRFTWRAQDACGAFSNAATLEITVRPTTLEYLFTDVATSNLQAAALRVSEKGLMSGQAMGGKHYFHPEQGLTRAAFVAILLKATETQVQEATDTGFEDDAEIPAPMKGTILYAKEKGWLGTDTHFRPNDVITRAEAAEIGSAVLGLGKPGYAETVEDFETIPVDVADAVYAIYEGGYIQVMADGRINPTGSLSRGDAACFFARVLDEKGN